MAIYSTPHHRTAARLTYKLARQAGFTLVELMVALVLGLLLIGGVVSVYISTQQNFKTTENLSRLQEGARFAFEQMGREVREAGANPCGVKAVSSLVRTGTTVGTAPPWWADWDAGTLVGFNGTTTVASGASFGATVNSRVTGTEAILMMRLRMDDGDLRVISAHDPVGKKITVNSTDQYGAKELVLACDNSSGAIFQIDNVSVAGGVKSLTYDSAASNGNCTDSLGWPQPSVCTGVTTATKTISPGGFVAKYDPAFWYVGIGSNGTSNSLYRVAIKLLATGNQGPEPQEMVTDVSNLEVEFLTRDKSTSPETLAASWVKADNAVFTAAGGWSDKNTDEVVAVRLTLTFLSPDAVGTDGKPLERKTIAVIGLRNREVKS